MEPDDVYESADDMRTPFVLGKPIKNPADFYGRREVLRDLFEAVQNGQLVSVVGEHRCGNTSTIYQMVHPDVRRRYLTPEQDRGLLFALISSQLAADSPESLFRRIARTLRRADPTARIDFGAETDRRWLEDYLEDLADRRRRLVLLMDEFEVLSGFRHGFWDWFEGLVNEFDLSIVATSRIDLGEFRARHGGPPFFNLFRSIYIGSFRPETVETFLREKSEITDFDFLAVRDRIEELAGRFPYYMQVASALFYFHAPAAGDLDSATFEAVEGEFRVRTQALFDDAWTKLPASEREALAAMVLGEVPAGSDEATHHQAVQSLERRGYVLDGRIFSSAMAAFVRGQLRRVSLNTETGQVRIDRRLVDLPPKAFALLAYLVEREGQVVTRDEIVRAVWPDLDPSELADAALDEALVALRAAVEPSNGAAQHIERLGFGAVRFVNSRFEQPGS